MDLADSRRLLRTATRLAVAIAVLLVLLKLGAWLLTGSVSVLASLIDSLMDAGASLVNLLAVGYALTPPDRGHRFGHGKAEDLAGLAQATFIIGSALFLAMHALERLLRPAPIDHVAAGLVTMVLSMVATALLLRVQYRAVRLTGSNAVRADALHYASDFAANGATLLALLLAHFGWPGMDPLFALAIAGYILFSAYCIAVAAVGRLMDHELPLEEREHIAGIARGTPGVLGVHGLRTRQAGRVQLLVLHLELDGDLPLRDAHAISRRVECSLARAFPGADITIHQDPSGIDEQDTPRIDP